jgi:hypothetical protein
MIHMGITDDCVQAKSKLLSTSSVHLNKCLSLTVTSHGLESTTEPIQCLGEFLREFLQTVHLLFGREHSIIEADVACL